MVKSMTGFSRTERESEGITYSVELKSLNSKHLSLDIKLSEAFSELEIAISRYLREKLNRGTVKVQIDIIFNDREISIKPDLGIATAYYEALNQIADKFRISDRITLDFFTRLKDVMKYRLPPELTEKIWGDLREVLNDALEKLSEDRAQEGENLAKAMTEYLDSMEEIVESIKPSVSDLTGYYREKLSNRIAKILETDVDENRLEQEIAILAEKADISEELVRLESHIEAFRNLLAGDGECGVKLDFICQELHREFSTIASKSKKLEITSLSIEGRTIVNKLREQVQNIE